MIKSGCEIEWHPVSEKDTRREYNLVVNSLGTDRQSPSSAIPLGLFPLVVKGEAMRINPSRCSTFHVAALAFGLFVPLLAFGQAPQPAQVASRFAGDWVEDQSQRTIGAERSLTFRNGANGLEEVRGSYSRPFVESVRFGVGPYAFGDPNATLEWNEQGNGRFECTLTINGKTPEPREITVSPDGKTLTEMTQRNLSDGRRSATTIVYSRTSGSGQKLEGVWKPQTVRSDTSETISIQAVGSALKISAGTGMTFVLTFDGKAAAVTGPGLIAGVTVTGKIISDGEIQNAIARLGTPTGTSTWTLSADGKTLTRSVMTLGPDASKEPSVTVYTKQ